MDPSLDLEAGDVSSPAINSAPPDLDLSAGDITPPIMPSIKTAIDPIALATKHATAAGLDPELIKAQMHQESGGHPAVVSSKGAIGLMQLMPKTAQGLGVDPKDPDQNVKGGVDYMSSLLKEFNGNTAQALAAYNAGPAAVKDFRDGTNTSGKNPYGRKTADGIPPFAETQNYVKSIMGKYTASMGLEDGDVKAQPQQESKPAPLSQADAISQAQQVYSDDPLKQRFIQNVVNSPRFQANTRDEQKRILQGQLTKLSPEQIDAILQPVPTETTKTPPDAGDRFVHNVYTHSLGPLLDLAQAQLDYKRPEGQQAQALTDAGEAHKKAVYAQAGQEFHAGNYGQAAKTVLGLLDPRTDKQPGTDPSEPLQQFVNGLVQSHVDEAHQTAADFKKAREDKNFFGPVGSRNKLEDYLTTFKDAVLTATPGLGPAAEQTVKDMQADQKKGDTAGAVGDAFGFLGTVFGPKLIGKAIGIASEAAGKVPGKIVSKVISPKDVVNQAANDMRVPLTAGQAMSGEGGGMVAQTTRTVTQGLEAVANRMPTTSGIMDRASLAAHEAAIKAGQRLVEGSGPEEADLTAAPEGRALIPGQRLTDVPTSINLEHPEVQAELARQAEATQQAGGVRVLTPDEAISETRDLLGMDDATYHSLFNEGQRVNIIEAVKALGPKATPVLVNLGKDLLTGTPVPTALAKAAIAGSGVGIDLLVKWMKDNGKFPEWVPDKVINSVGKAAKGAVSDVVKGKDVSQVAGRAAETVGKGVVNSAADALKDTGSDMPTADSVAEKAQASLDSFKAKTKALDDAGKTVDRLSQDPKAAPAELSAAKNAHIKAVGEAADAKEIARKAIDDYHRATGDLESDPEARPTPSGDVIGIRDKISDLASRAVKAVRGKVTDITNKFGEKVQTINETDPDFHKVMEEHFGKDNLPFLGRKLLADVLDKATDQKYKTIDWKQFQKAWEGIDPENKAAMMDPQTVKNVDLLAKVAERAKLRNFSKVEKTAGWLRDGMVNKAHSLGMRTVADFFDWARKHDYMAEGPMRNPMGKTIGFMLWAYNAAKDAPRAMSSMNPIIPLEHVGGYFGGRAIAKVLATRGGANTLIQALSPENVASGGVKIGTYATRQLARQRVAAILALDSMQNERQHDVMDDIAPRK